jgi:hypothetical protein
MLTKLWTIGQTSLSKGIFMLINLGGINERFAKPLSTIRSFTYWSYSNEHLDCKLHLLMVSFIVRRKLDTKLFVKKKLFHLISICFKVKSIFMRLLRWCYNKKRRDGEHNIRLEDVLAVDEVGEELALVLIGTIRTGRFWHETITAAGHSRNDRGLT